MAKSNVKKIKTAQNQADRPTMTNRGRKKKTDELLEGVSSGQEVPYKKNRTNKTLDYKEYKDETFTSDFTGRLSDVAARSTRSNHKAVRSTRSSELTFRTSVSTSSIEDRPEDNTLINESNAGIKTKQTAPNNETSLIRTKRSTRNRSKKQAVKEDHSSSGVHSQTFNEEDDRPRPRKNVKRKNKKRQEISDFKEKKKRAVDSTVNTTSSSAYSAASVSASHISRTDLSSSHNRPEDQNEETGESNENAGYDVNIMRKIFYAAQFVHKQQKCVQSLYKLIKEIKFEIFYEEFCRNVKCVLQFESENSKVVYILDMIATFMISVKNENLLKNKINEDTFDEIGLELFGKDTFTVLTISKTYKNLLDYILSDALIPFLNSVNANTRLNTLYLVRKILQHVVDIEFNIYERLKSGLIDRSRDKNANARLSAIYTIHRFQNVDDPNDKVIGALRFHLKHDPTHSVRFACLKVIYPTKEVIPDLILKTRDIKSKIREMAFQKIAKKVDLKELTVKQRLTLLNNGLKDRDPKVKQAVREFLVPAWIKYYDDDLTEVLNDLDVTVNSEVISKFLNIAFQYSFSIKIEKSTKLHLLIDKFYDEYLDQQSLLNKRQLSPENCLFWRCLGAFMKMNEDEVLKYQPDLEKRMNLRKEINSLLEAIDDLEVDQNKRRENLPDEGETDQNTIDENKQPSSESKCVTEIGNDDHEEPVNREDYEVELNRANPVDLIVPSLSNFVAFFKKFCLDVKLNQYQQDELIELEFIFKELCLFLDNYDIADDSQKRLITNFVEEIIMMEGLGDKFDEYIENLMRFLSKSVLKTNEELISYTVHITNKVEASLENEDPEEELPMVDPKMIRTLELDFARESIAYNELKINLEHAVVKQEYDIAHDIKIQVDKIKTKMDSLKNEINRMQNISIRQRPEPEIVIEIKDHPTVHVKLLQIFGSCLRYGQFRNLTAIMDTRITKYIIPGILSTDSRIRYYALKALNHACFLSSSLAARFCALYHEICTKDNAFLQNCALQGLIDSLVEHGLHILYPDEDESKVTSNQEQRNEPQSFLDMHQQTQSQEDGAKRSNTNSMFTNTREFTKASSFMNQSEIASPDISMTEEDEASESSKVSEVHHITSLKNDLDEQENDEEYIERQADLTMKSQIIDLNKTAMQLEKEEEIIKQLTKFLLKFIRTEEEEIKSSSVMGICKLLLLGRIYSPLLLSELILLWYNSSTSLSIQHDIGTFLPIYCLASSTYKIDIPENFSGQHCLLECFMSTVENVYRLERGEQLEVSFDLMRSNYYDSDIDVLNVIDFMLNLLEPANHVKIVFEFCDRLLEILQVNRDDEYELKEPFMTKYLIRSLESFKLFELTDEQREELKGQIAKIQNEQRFSELKKQFQTKIEKFLQKL